MLLGPADIHPLQHLGPVAGFGAAGTCVDLEERVVGVGLAVEKGLEFGRPRAGLQRLQRRLGLGHDLVVALGLAHRHELDVVLELLRHRLVAVDGVDERLPVAA